MDKYMKLMAVKGLILSLDDQLYQYLQKDALSEKIKKVIVDKYYEAIVEQLMDEPEKMKDNPCYIITINGVNHDFYEQTISWEQVVGLTNLALTGNELLTITYSHGDTSGTLEVIESIQIKDKMVFNVEKTIGA